MSPYYASLNKLDEFICNFGFNLGLHQTVYKAIKVGQPCKQACIPFEGELLQLNVSHAICNGKTNFALKCSIKEINAGFSLMQRPATLQQQDIAATGNSWRHYHFMPPVSGLSSNTFPKGNFGSFIS